mmetsp:Transcript_6913/g.16624  ORF Transcript_6913/g.16624 Transcript_6913/m.16624 type:complete len:215 (-) Transcript_6913:4078-4722(-)
MSTPMFSMMIVWPLVMAASSLRSQFFWVSWNTMRPLFSSRLRSHLIPCICGSMISGHRLHLEMMAPFSSDTGSSGRPWLIILALSAAVVSWESGEAPAVIGTLRFTRSSTHRVFQRAVRFGWSKAPTYDTKPAAIIQSPTRVPWSRRSLSMSRPQRSFSLARPPTRRTARPSLALQRAASASTSAFSSVAATNLAWRAASFASTAATVFCASSS